MDDNENNGIDEKIVKDKKSKKSIVTLTVILLFIAVILFAFLPDWNSSNAANIKIGANQMATDSNGKLTDAFVKAATVSDTSKDYVIMSSPDGADVAYGVDEKAGKQVVRVYNGRRINIAITGLDSRLGTTSNHADANHILSILLDSGKIEITSIPRDTRANAGYSDTCPLNKLTVVRAVKGREAYLKEAARIAGYDRIHYYVEVGFSQVMGILELLGYTDAQSTLQVLRSRKGLGGDDYQRCYNQGQFIRQTMLRHFGKLNGALGELIIRGGLALVESNLTTKDIKNIVSTLKSKGFPRSADDVVMRVRPAMGMNFKVYDFADRSALKTLQKKIEGFNRYHENDSTLQKKYNVAAKLQHAVNKAIADSSKNPKAVIKGLETYFAQRAWFQVDNKIERLKIRDQMSNLLISAYYKRRMPAKAQKVYEIISNEKEVFKTSIFQ